MPPQNGADGSGTEIALADRTLAVAGAIVLLISIVFAIGSPGLLGALFVLAIVTAMAVIGAYTSVVGTKSTPIRRWLGAIVALVAGGTVLYFAETIVALLVAPAVLAAGLGRTASWRLRLVGILCLLGAALLIVATG